LQTLNPERNTLSEVIRERERWLYTGVGDKSDERGNVTDYSIPLDQHNRIDSSQFLIEAESINKLLDSRRHGADQVEFWLSHREFESDFGYVTDGLQWISSAMTQIPTTTHGLSISI
jgi:hypothetical protein